MYVTKDLNLTCEVRLQDGTLVARFTCDSEDELHDFENADHVDMPVLVHVKHLQLFVGNAVLVVGKDT
jgi:hypothetical protein